MPRKGASQPREEALVRAMDHFGTYLLGYFESLCKDRLLAEDLSQQLWVYVYEKFSEKDFEHAGFLKRKAYQLFVDEMRKRGVRSHVTFVEDPPDYPSISDGREPMDAREERELFDSFWEQFDPLNFTDSEKQVFWLSARYGYTMKEVGEKLGIPHSTAHDWLKSVKGRCLQFLNSRQDHD